MAFINLLIIGFAAIFLVAVHAQIVPPPGIAKLFNVAFNQTLWSYTPDGRQSIQNMGVGTFAVIYDSNAVSKFYYSITFTPPNGAASTGRFWAFRLANGSYDTYDLYQGSCGRYIAPPNFLIPDASQCTGWTTQGKTTWLLTCTNSRFDQYTSEVDGGFYSVTTTTAPGYVTLANQTLFSSYLSLSSFNHSETGVMILNATGSSPTVPASYWNLPSICQKLETVVLDEASRFMHRVKGMWKK